MNLRFRTEDVRRIIEQSKNDTEWKKGYSGPTGPGVFLVGDNGVYLMSTGQNQEMKDYGGKRGKSLDVVYAEECNPYTMDFDTWWENKRASFGGDDGAEYLEAAMIEPYLSGEFLELRLSEKNIEVVVRRSKADRVRALRQAWYLRHGFTRQKLIPLRMEMIREGICTADEWDEYLAEGDAGPTGNQSGQSGADTSAEGGDAATGVVSDDELVNPTRKIQID